MYKNKRKLQSSIEFVIIMAAVASMSVVGLSFYSHVHSIFMKAINNTSNPNNSISLLQNATFSISAYIFAPELRIGNESELTLLVTTSIPSNVFIRAKGSGITISPENINSKIISGQEFYNFYVSPEDSGFGNVSFEITASNGSISSNYNISSTLYTYLSNNTEIGNNLSNASSVSNVYIKPESEFLSYNVAKPANLYYITESSHCSELNFWGQQMSIQSQCGNASWYFWAFSDSCYYGSAQVPTKTYCVYRHYSGYNASMLESNPSYIYNVTMGLRYKGVNLSSDITSKKPKSNITNGNRIFGFADVGNSIYAQVAFQSPLYIISSKSNNYTISNANYTAYSYAYSNIEDELAYYNNSDNENLGTINREIYAYNNTLLKFISAITPVNSSECSLSMQSGIRSYNCKPLSPMQFYNASIYLYNYTANQSEYSYMGSDIKVN
jgi:hypothetical protein